MYTGQGCPKAGAYGPLHGAYKLLPIVKLSAQKTITAWLSYPVSTMHGMQLLPVHFAVCPVQSSLHDPGFNKVPAQSP